MTRTRPALTPPPPEPYVVVHVCTAAGLHPSGRDATYVSGAHRELALWQAWVDVHRAHGFVAREDR